MPRTLQTVQRAEFRGVILALQALDAVHLGVDNLNVVRQVGWLLDVVESSRPAELMNDGDLITLVRKMIERRDGNTVSVTKVKGHDDEDMVRDGRVRDLDRLGNNAADEAADFGRRRVDPGVIDTRRNLSPEHVGVGVPLQWIFIAFSRAVANHDDSAGTASRSSSLVCWCPSQEA